MEEDKKSRPTNGAYISINAQRIKQIAEWFPGATLGVERAAGKTTAIIEMIHELRGNAAYFGMDPDMANRFEYQYRNAYPDDNQPICTSKVSALRGIRTGPIFVDEPWLIKRAILDELRGFPVAIYLGTGF